MAAVVPKLMSAALHGKAVSVTLKNGVIVQGRVVEFDAETSNMVVDVSGARASSVNLNTPPHLLCVPRATIRGSAVAFIDFDAKDVDLLLVTRASLAA